jgi:hypothetical protein
MARTEDLDVLACEIELRPREAPGFHDVASSVRRIERLPGALLVEFDPAAERTVQAIVEAERLCCAGLDWDLRTAPSLQVRIGADEGQLDVLERLVRGT